MNNIIDKLHKNHLLGKIFHSVDYCLEEELKGCQSVLDIGCGPSSPLKNIKNIKFSVGVEAFKPYLEESKRKRIHSKYINKKIDELEFPDKSFDAVILIEVIEHLDKTSVLKLLKKANKWAKKKIIITTPNGYVPQKEVDSNPLQKHLSGWSVDDMTKLGFDCHGLAGLKILRDNSEKDTMDDNDLTASIKYKPKLFWFAFATVSQIITFYFPILAFELFCVSNYDYKREY